MHPESEPVRQGRLERTCQNDQAGRVRGSPEESIGIKNVIRRDLKDVRINRVRILRVVRPLFRFFQHIEGVVLPSRNLPLVRAHNITGLTLLCARYSDLLCCWVHRLRSLNGEHDLRHIHDGEGDEDVFFCSTAVGCLYANGEPVLVLFEVVSLEHHHSRSIATIHELVEQRRKESHTAILYLGASILPTHLQVANHTCRIVCN
mmetsp:Transcript_19351/g.45003  ORF Transcript_19351/g.45003 Transcript_19351/m.45003 type:complete len:204 (+) Transcript_19351:4344-4955(+)